MFLQRELRKQAWRRGLQKRAQRVQEDAETLERLAKKNPQLTSGLMHGYANNSVNIKDMLLSGINAQTLFHTWLRNAPVLCMMLPWEIIIYLYVTNCRHPRSAEG